MRSVGRQRGSSLSYRVISKLGPLPDSQSIELWTRERENDIFVSSTRSPFSPAYRPPHCSIYHPVTSPSLTRPLAHSSRPPLSHLSHPLCSDGTPSTLPASPTTVIPMNTTGRSFPASLCCCVSQTVSPRSLSTTRPPLLHGSPSFMPL